MSTRTDIINLYIGYYNRAPDVDGLNYWIGRAEAGMSLAAIAASYSVQVESVANYPYLADPANSSPTDFIKTVYQNLFNREPDTEGLTYWSEQLANAAGNPDAIGAMIINIISGAKTAPDSTILENKRTVADDWATNLASSSSSTYDAAATASAKSILSTVTADTSTVDAAKAQTTTFITTIDNATTRFTGSDLSNIANGTLSITSDIYTYDANPADTHSVTVSNDADLVIDGALNLRGASSALTVSGTGSTLTIKAGLDGSTSDFGQYAGDFHTATITDGGLLQLDKNMSVGGIDINTQDGRGTVGGQSNAIMTISNGGKVNVAGDANIAAPYDLSNGNGTETVKTTMTVDGNTSSLTVAGYVNVGRSGGQATLNIKNGADVTFSKGANFSENETSTMKATTDITVDGDGSTLTLGEFSQFAVYQNGSGSITLNDKATLSANEFSLGRAGGTATLTVQNGATFNASSYVNIAQYSGSTATVTVDNGTINLTESFDVGDFRNGEVFTSGGSITAVSGGKASADITIKNGGAITTDKQISAAYLYETSEGFAANGETSAVNITVTGTGSLLESKDNYSDFGVSVGAVADVKVQDGGTVKVAKGANFGTTAENLTGVDGGTGHLTVDGSGSSFSVTTESKDLNFGNGNNATGTLTISNGGSVSSGGVKFGESGGIGTATINNGTLNVSHVYTDGSAAGIEIGRDSSTLGASSMSVTNGGKVIIDGQNAKTPYVTIGRNSGAEGSLEISGAGSSVTIINDLPRGTNGSTDFGNAFATIGRDGTGTLSIKDGGELKLTSSGLVVVGQNTGASGTVTIDGANSKLEFGASLYIGPFDTTQSSTASVTLSNGGELVSTGTRVTPSGSTESGIFLQGDNSTLSVDSQSKVTSDVKINKGDLIVGPAIETVSITGNIEQAGGKISFEVESGKSDKLAVSGTAKLESIFAIELENGYSGQAGDSFEIMSASSFDVGSTFSLAMTGLADGLDAQVKFSGGVAVLGIYDTQVDDFLVA